MELEKKRILVGDPSPLTEQWIRKHASFQEYSWQFFSNGKEIDPLIDQFHPDLIILELFLPYVHGIQILKEIKGRYPQIPVMIMTYEIMLQNFKASIESGAEYFLEKPLDMDHFFDIISLHFENQLPTPLFSGNQGIDFDIDSYYNPKLATPSSYLKFWGTRGSVSVSGEDYIRFGGNTSCLEIRHKKHSIIIDAGTGIRPLGEKIMEEKKNSEIHLLISHTHQDHILGFPFFSPLYHEKTKLTVWSPIGFEKTTESLFSEMLTYSFFPVRLEQMHAEVAFKDLLDSETYLFGDIEISCCYTYHPGATLGFKIKIGDEHIGYITDNELFVGYLGDPKYLSIDHPFLDYHKHLIHFLSDCSTIVHEAQYFPKEYEQHIGWGHSSLTNATALFRFLNCKKWIVTHHDPRHTDEDLQIKLKLHQAILDEVGINCELVYAFDGMILPFHL